MKSKITFAVLSLLLFSMLQGQETSMPRKEIAVQLFARASYIDYDLYTTPGVGVRYGKHCAFGGPLLSYEFRYKFPLEGFFAGYSFYPSWKFKRLSGHATVMYQQENFARNGSYFTLTAGYGLDFRLLKNLYIDQSFSMGMDGRIATESDYQYYYSPDFITLVQLGLRYDFMLRKSETR